MCLISNSTYAERLKCVHLQRNHYRNQRRSSSYFKIMKAYSKTGNSKVICEEASSPLPRSPYTLHCVAQFIPKICPCPRGGLDSRLMHGFLGQADQIHQTASRSDQPFFQNSRSLPMEGQTDRTNGKVGLYRNSRLASWHCDAANNVINTCHHWRNSCTSSAGVSAAATSTTLSSQTARDFILRPVSEIQRGIDRKSKSFLSTFILPSYRGVSKLQFYMSARVE